MRYSREYIQRAIANAYKESNVYAKFILRDTDQLIDNVVYLSPSSEDELISAAHIVVDEYANTTSA